MLNFDIIYNNGVKAFCIGDDLYDLFSGAKLEDYTGKVYINRDCIMRTWLTGKERHWAVDMIKQ